METATTGDATLGDTERCGVGPRHPGSYARLAQVRGDLGSCGVLVAPAWLLLLSVAPTLDEHGEVNVHCEWHPEGRSSHDL